MGDESGQSMVELALTLPALLLVVTGLMSFGVTFNNYMILTDATAVAARQLTVSRGQTTDPCQTFANSLYAAAPLLTASNLKFTITLNGTQYTKPSCSGSATSGAPANMVLGTNAVVTVTYPFALGIYGLKLTTPTSVLTAQTTELMQ
ncbi:Flp pilus assembly protein TadG [Granulicella aggregans]|uniref:Flp pilus assembly protein TadG n=1 Tax=Granulicella aggregans TaxID=474949 RepID=A0A7W7ZGN1_9BACT|nr:Flp pilus assembly protein TadG [Granulicella aggregans]